jgi:hypothetical protein
MIDTRMNGYIHTYHSSDYAHPHAHKQYLDRQTDRHTDSEILSVAITSIVTQCIHIHTHIHTHTLKRTQRDTERSYHEYRKMMNEGLSPLAGQNKGDQIRGEGTEIQVQDSEHESQGSSDSNTKADRPMAHFAAAKLQP